MTDELLDIANQMTALLPQFRDGGSMAGLFLPSPHGATFIGLVLDAKHILEEGLGNQNSFARTLVKSVNDGAGGMTGGPSYASVEEAAEIIRAGAKAIARAQSRPRARAHRWRSLR